MRIVLFLLLLPLLSLGQGKPLSFTSSLPINDGYKIHEWLNSNCRETKENKDYGEYVGYSDFVYNSKIFYGSMGTKGVVRYKVIITLKEGSAKYEITHFEHISNPNNEINLSFGLLTEDENCPYHLKGQRKGWENRIWVELKEVATAEAARIGKSLQQL